MVKVAQTTILLEYEPLLAKIFVWFNSLIYPTWASLYFHTTHSTKKTNKKTYIPGVWLIWNSYTPAQKEN